MNNTATRFTALRKGPCFTLLHLTNPNIDIRTFNDNCRAYISYVSGGLFTYDYFWWIAEDDSVYLAVSGNRIAITVIMNYINNSSHVFEVMHLSRGVLTFNALVSKLFQRRKRTVGHKRSFGGSRK